MKELIKGGILLLLGVSVMCASSVNLDINDKKVIKFQKEAIAKNKQYTLQDLKIVKKNSIGKDFKSYQLELTLKNNSNNEVVKAPYFVFSNGEHITNNMVNMKSGVIIGAKTMDNYRKQILKKKEAQNAKFALPESIYTKDRFIAGNPKAKTKVVLFSDPLCVYCIKFLPNWVRSVKKRDDIALYHLDFPLDKMHPSARTVAAAIKIATKKGVKNAVYKVYAANMENYFDVYKTRDTKVVLEAINDILETNISLKELKNKLIKEEVDKEFKLGLKYKVKGTPAVFFNGVNQYGREKFQNFLETK